MSDAEKADLPAVMWFVHALTESDADGSEIALDGGKYRIACDSPYTRSLITELARLYLAQRDDLYRLHAEVQAQPWRPASEVPDGPYSSCRCRRVLVTSPALQYVVGEGVAEGCHDGERWLVRLNGKIVPHAVTHWRHLPTAPEAAPPYEAVRAEVERLRVCSA